MQKIIFHTPVGEIIGKQDQGVVRVLGVPYARAERYQYSEPLPPFSEPFFAKKYAPAPPQVPSPVLEQVLGVDLLERLKMDEDCQYLSITIPENRNERERLSVMIWIYGGSYATGAGDAVVYDPKLLVQEQNVIVVNINYRLGILGFLGDGKNRPANLGLLDMIAAIRWVKNNIAAFGGNPENITLFGQSAGGDAIAHLLVAEGMEGLFQNAIIQSAPLGIRKERQRMTQAMNTMVQDMPANAPLENILEKQTGIATAMRKFGLKGGMPFGVQYGCFPLPKEADIEMEWSSAAKRFNILIGYSDEETSLFAPFIVPLQKMKKVPLLGAAIEQFLVKKTTDILYRKPAIAFAKMMAKNGGNIYQYNISWGAKNGFGATHTIDIPLLFGDENTWKAAQLLKGIPWEKQYKDGKQLRQIWGQFARNGKLEKQLTVQGLVRYRHIG